MVQVIGLVQWMWSVGNLLQVGLHEQKDQTGRPLEVSSNLSPAVIL